MNIPTTEWEFLVKARITKNGEELITTTWSSSDNFDDCYRKMENYIKKHSDTTDEIVKHILHTSSKEYPTTRWSTY